MVTFTPACSSRAIPRPAADVRVEHADHGPLDARSDERLGA